MGYTIFVGVLFLIAILGGIGFGIYYNVEVDKSFKAYL